MTSVEFVGANNESLRFQTDAFHISCPISSLASELSIAQPGHCEHGDEGSVRLNLVQLVCKKRTCQIEDEA